MKVLLVGSEALPFVSTGGLGDVMGALPGALLGVLPKGSDVRVVLPLYAAIDPVWRAEFTFVRDIIVPLAWRKLYCGIFSCVREGVTYYFLDNEYYFRRDALYGAFDDGERFAFFSRAALELCEALDFYPDVLHANDWQSALTVIYLKLIYRQKKYFAPIKTVFTIHNIAYQGKFDHAILEDIFDLDAVHRAAVDYNGCINLMKGAITLADAVTTVSPSYAAEIKTEPFAEGLHYVINKASSKLCGILNGIDTAYYDPAHDTDIFAHYTATALSGKAKNKLGLQRMLGLPERDDAPLFSMICRLVYPKGIDLIAQSAERLLTQDVQFVLLGTGDKYYEDYFVRLKTQYPSKVSALFLYSKDLSKKIYAASDFFLMPSRTEPCGLSQMIASRYGAVPIVHETGGLKDTIHDIGFGDIGNGFSFRDYNPDSFSHTIDRALELYADKKKRQSLQKKVMGIDFGWTKSAENYAQLYERLCAH